MSGGTGRIPTFVVTGFLGSGKTTLLRSVLHDPAFANTAVIVNEFGAVGLDHELMAHAQERTIVMPGGCVCCSIREDVETTLRELLDRVDSGALPAFDRLVVETTGLADPVPLLFTLHASPLAAARLKLESVIVTVDGVLGQATLERHAESTKQITAADRIVITKCDMVGEVDIAVLAARLRLSNPWAEIERRNLLLERPVDLFAGGRYDSKKDPAHASRWVLGALGDGHGGALDRRTEHAHDVRHHAAIGVHGTAHAASVRSFCVSYDHKTDWTGFGIWLTATLHRYGDRFLRIKGLLAVDGMPGPTVIHSVQHIVHPPIHLDTWPSADRRSRLVCIVQDLDAPSVERSLRAFTRIEPQETASASAYRLAGAGGTVGGRPIRRVTAPRWLKG